VTEPAVQPPGLGPTGAEAHPSKRIASEPAAAHGIHDAVDEQRAETRARRSRRLRIAVTAAICALMALIVGSCSFIGARAKARQHDKELWRGVVMARAEYGCCAGTRVAACADAERALVELSTRLHARADGAGDRFSRAVGGLIGTADIDLGSEMDVAHVDETLAECRARVEVERLRNELHEKAEERR
jgi:hypothetical protein